MILQAAGLAVLAVLLAWPIPQLLARIRWPQSSPAAQLLLWQAIALAGGLAMIGAPLSLGLAPLGPSLPEALAAGVEAGVTATPVPLPLLSFLALITAAGIAGYLIAHLVSTVVQVAAGRRRHAQLLALLSTPHPTIEGARVLDDDRMLAYCLPQGVRSLTVLTRGLLEVLDDDELAAVLAHEQTHVSQRHGVVLVAFRAWRESLPGFPVAALAQVRVAGLIEMLADDRARARAGDEAVLRAIVKVAGQDAAPAQSGVAGAGAEEATAILRDRVERIAHPVPVRALPIFAAATCAVSLVAVPTLMIFLPALGL